VTRSLRSVARDRGIGGDRGPHGGAGGAEAGGPQARGPEGRVATGTLAVPVTAALNIAALKTRSPASCVARGAYFRFPEARTVLYVVPTARWRCGCRKTAWSRIR